MRLPEVFEGEDALSVRCRRWFRRSDHGFEAAHRREYDRL